MATTSLQEDADESLMARVQNGDHQAFSVLVHRHTDRFFAVAYRMLSDYGEAEDVVQDAFLKLWNNPQMWDAEQGAKFTTWFYRVVTNLCIDRGRKLGRVSASDILERFASDEDLQDKSLYERQRQALLEEAIQGLPDKQKAALTLCFYEELSNKDAADILGVGVKALESLLMRAKAGIKDVLIRDDIIQEKEQANG